MNQLPKGWILLTLKDCGDIVSGGTPSTGRSEYWGNEIPWITPADLSGYKKKLIEKGRKSISRKGLENSSARLMPKGSVLFSSRAPIGYVAIAENEISTNQGFKSIVPNGVVDSEFLFYYLKSIKNLAENRASGTTFLELSGKAFSQLPISVPPLPEQHRIVAKLEELFSELDNGIAHLKKAQVQLKVYRQAVLKAAFEGKLTEKWRDQQRAAGNLPSADALLAQIQEERKRYSRKPKEYPQLTEAEVRDLPELPEGWKWVRFGNVTYKIGDVDHKMPSTQPNGIPYLSTGDITPGHHLNFKGVKTISRADYSQLSRKIRPQKGDLIFPRYGTIGRNALVETDIDFLVSYSCAIIKPITKFFKPKYVFYYSISPIITKEVEKYAVQTTQANIGISSIERFLFPLMSVQEQHQIVQEIESRLSVCGHLEQEIDKALEQSEALRQSILKKAFEGRLVPQDPNDEPAGELLKRIKREIPQ